MVALASSGSVNNFVASIPHFISSDMSIDIKPTQPQMNVLKVPIFTTEFANNDTKSRHVLTHRSIGVEGWIYLSSIDSGTEI